MKRVLTKEDEYLIRDYYLAVTTLELAQLIGCPKGTIQSAKQRMGLKTPNELTRQRQSEGRIRNNAATPHPHDELLRAEYLITNVNQLSIKIGRSETYVKGRLKTLGLVIPPEIIERRKKDSRLKKGSIPPNKGRKQSEYMTPEQIARTAATRFQKGQRIHNESYDGAIRIRHSSKARGGKPHKMIRISKGKWKELQIYNWEKINGPVPKGSVLACKDGDTLNCHPDNWFVLTMAEHAMRNQSREKATATMRQLYQEGRINNPMINMHDKVLAGWLFKNDPEAQKEVLKHPHILDLKRQQITLKRTIRERKNNKAGEQDAE
jgi:hypothetical protein